MDFEIDRYSGNERHGGQFLHRVDAPVYNIRSRMLGIQFYPLALLELLDIFHHMPE